MNASSLAKVREGHNYETNPVGVSFFQCIFSDHQSLGLNIVPRLLNYEASRIRKTVNCCIVISSTVSDIMPGDIIVKINDSLLIGLHQSRQLNDFFDESMKTIRDAQNPRCVLFLRPAGSSEYYVTGLSTQLVVSLHPEEERLLSGYVPKPSPTPTSKEVITPLNLPYLSEEDEIKRKVEEHMRHFADIKYQAEVKKTNDEKQRAHAEELRVLELIRTEKAEASRMAEAAIAVEQEARVKRIAEAVRARVQEAQCRMELSLINETKKKEEEEDEARTERIAALAKARIDEEVAQIATDTAERLREIARKESEGIAREERVAAEVTKRLLEEKSNLLAEEERKKSEEESTRLMIMDLDKKEKALAENARLKVEESKLRREREAEEILLLQKRTAEDTIRQDASMQQWLQDEVKRRVEDEVKRRVDLARQKRAEEESRNVVQPVPLSLLDGSSTLLETTFPDNQPLGLTLVPHSVHFTSASGDVVNISCCMVAASSLTTEIHQSDIAVMINNISLLSIDSKGRATSTRNFETAMKLISDISSSRTIRFFRPARSVADDSRISAISLSDAAMLLQD